MFHAEAARLYGATEDEIAEAAMMAAHTMSASTFMNAMGTDCEDFKQETLQIVGNIKAQAAKDRSGQGQAPSHRSGLPPPAGAHV